MKAQLMVLAAGLTVAIAPMTMQAEVPGPHPAYLHALSDLRAARHYLNDEGWAPQAIRQDDGEAVHEIDLAINEIKKASIDDGKGLNDPYPIDTRLSPHDRFRKANELLLSAHNDLSRAEDVQQARGMRDRALVHVDRAHGIVDRTERTAHWQ